MNIPGHDPPDSRPQPGAGGNQNPPDNPQVTTIPLVPEGKNMGIQTSRPVASQINTPQLADHGINIVPNTAPLPTIGNSPASVDSAGNVVINSQTITPNAPPVTIDRTPVALGGAGLIIGGASTVAIGHPQITPLAIIGGSPAVVDSSGNVIVNNQVITPNAPTVVIDNTPVHLGTAGLVIGSSSPIAINNIPQNTPLTIAGGLPASVDSSGNVFVSNQIITPNAPAVVINNTPVRLGTAGLVVGSSSPIVINKSPATTLAVIGGSPASVDSSGNIVINNQIITPNAPAITINHTPVRLGTAGLAIGDAPPIVVKQNVPGAPLALIGGSPVSMDKSGNIKVNDQVIHSGVPVTINNTPVLLGTAGLVYGGPVTVPVDHNPHYFVGSQQLKPGGAPIVNLGTTYSLAPHATAVVINSPASPAPIPIGNSLPILTIGNSAITPNSNSNYVVAGQTLVPNGSPLTVSGTTYSLAPHAAAIVVNGATTPIYVPSQTPVLTIGSSVITANSKSEYIIASQTLAPAGPPITISGTTFSLAPLGSAIVINGVTSRLYASPPSSPTILTIGSSTISANKNAQFVIAGQTLIPGGSAITIPATTISGTPIPATTIPASTISLGPSARFIVVDGLTSALAIPTPPPPTTQNLGAIIAGGFGVPPTPSVFTIGTQTFTPSPSSFSIAGTTLSAGGPGITISGTSVSLEPEGTLLIGTSTIVLSLPTPPTSPSSTSTPTSTATPTTTNNQQQFKGVGFFEMNIGVRRPCTLGVRALLVLVLALVVVGMV